MNKMLHIKLIIFSLLISFSFNQSNWIPVTLGVFENSDCSGELQELFPSEFNTCLFQFTLNDDGTGSQSSCDSTNISFDGYLSWEIDDSSSLHITYSICEGDDNSCEDFLTEEECPDSCDWVTEIIMFNPTEQGNYNSIFSENGECEDGSDLGQDECEDNGMEWDEASCTYFEITEGILDCLNCDFEEEEDNENCDQYYTDFMTWLMTFNPLTSTLEECELGYSPLLSYCESNCEPEDVPSDYAICSDDLSQEMISMVCESMIDGDGNSCESDDDCSDWQFCDEYLYECTGNSCEDDADCEGDGVGCLNGICECENEEGCDEENDDVCLEDCPYFDIINDTDPSTDANIFCSYIVEWQDDLCLADCDSEFSGDISSLINQCIDCLDNQNCDDEFSPWRLCDGSEESNYEDWYCCSCNCSDFEDYDCLASEVENGTCEEESSCGDCLVEGYDYCIEYENAINDCNANDICYWDNSFAESYIDTNNNGMWDDGEEYEDVNGNGAYDGGYCAYDCESDEYCDCGSGTDGPPECMLDCDGVDQQDPSQDFDSFCNWLSNLDDECYTDCDGDEADIVNDLILSCGVSNTDYNCSDELSGTWTMVESGYYENIDCTGEMLPDSVNIPYSYALNDDCSWDLTFDLDYDDYWYYYYVNYCYYEPDKCSGIWMTELESVQLDSFIYIIDNSELYYWQSYQNDFVFEIIDDNTMINKYMNPGYYDYYDPYCYYQKFSKTSELNVEVMNPLDFELLKPYPNPFNPETKIEFTIGEPSNVNIGIYDIQGRLITNLVNQMLATGKHSVVWNASDKPSGIYFIRLTSGNYISKQKILLVK